MSSYGVYAIALKAGTRPLEHPPMGAIYVGQSWYTPEQRFWQHQDGDGGSWKIKSRCRFLRPELFADIQRVADQDYSVYLEEERAQRLWEAGFTVICNGEWIDRADRVRMPQPYDLDELRAVEGILCDHVSEANALAGRDLDPDELFRVFTWSSRQPTITDLVGGPTTLAGRYARRAGGSADRARGDRQRPIVIRPGLRFKARRASVPRAPVWPEFKPKGSTTVFSERPPLPELVVVIDQELLDRAAGEPTSQGDLLAGLLSHDYIRLLRYADDGPPPEVPRIEREHFGELIPGWLVVTEYLDGHGALVTVAKADGSGLTQSGILGNAVDVAAADDEADAYDGQAPADAAVRRRADALAAQAADAAGADMFITERPYLHAATWAVAGDVLIARPSEALGLVSLYLRTQGVFITWRSADGRGTHSMNRGLFYWVGTRELIPEGWRWFGACVQARQRDETLLYLGQSVFQRVQRALEARDAVHRALNKPQNNDIAEDALGNLDLVLLGLMSALDVVARVAHRALGLSTSEYAAGWQRERWVSQVNETAPALAGVVAPGTRGQLALVVVSRLRNSIHGAALDALAVASRLRAQPDETLVGLPHGEATELLAAIDGLGGRDAWGVRELIPGRFHTDPGVLVDRLFAEIVELLNELMANTPVERLPGVVPDKLVNEPPDEHGMFDEQNRQSIRWQLGL